MESDQFSFTRSFFKQTQDAELKPPMPHNFHFPIIRNSFKPACSCSHIADLEKSENSKENHSFTSSARWCRGSCCQKQSVKSTPQKREMKTTAINHHSCPYFMLGTFVWSCEKYLVRSAAKLASHHPKKRTQDLQRNVRSSFFPDELGSHEFRRVTAFKSVFTENTSFVVISTPLWCSWKYMGVDNHCRESYIEALEDMPSKPYTLHNIFKPKNNPKAISQNAVIRFSQKLRCLSRKKMEERKTDRESECWEAEAVPVFDYRLSFL